MNAQSDDAGSEPSILIVDSDIVSRHAIAAYLRHCGYLVIEAANTDEAFKALAEPLFGIDIILCEAEAQGTQSAFGLATWVHKNMPALEVRLAGSLERVADTAADLCENGPHMVRPYEPQAVMAYIKQLRAARDRAPSS